MFAEAGIAAEQIVVRYLLIGALIGLLTVALVFRSRVLSIGVLESSIRLTIAALLGAMGFVLGVVVVGGIDSHVILVNAVIVTASSCGAALLAGVRLPAAKT